MNQLVGQELVAAFNLELAFNLAVGPRPGRAEVRGFALSFRAASRAKTVFNIGQFAVF